MNNRISVLAIIDLGLGNVASVPNMIDHTGCAAGARRRLAGSPTSTATT